MPPASAMNSRRLIRSPRQNERPSILPGRARIKLLPAGALPRACQRLKIRQKHRARSYVVRSRAALSRADDHPDAMMVVLDMSCDLEPIRWPKPAFLLPGS
jgi:hypothetical protein